MQIVMRQVSGLGNQLFQFAAGLYYRQRYQASMRLAVDLPRNAFSHGYRRPFLLSQFSIDIPTPVLSRRERLLLSSRPSLGPAPALLRRAQGIQMFTEPLERRHSFLPDLPIASSTRTLYLSGYWQASGFAAAVADELRRSLAFRHPPADETATILQQIEGCGNSVSLHVRRGDYTLAVEGNIALPMAYYERAMSHFEQRLPDPTFFVFSDDITFARQHLPVAARIVFVDHHDDNRSHEDLRLMSACRHHIIANSSFSWWGAWLNARPGKIVYAPRYWHLTPQSFFPELCPAGWIVDP